MSSIRFTRRDFAARLAGVVPGLALAPATAFATPRAQQQGDGITHNNDAIHQEVMFKASRVRVYAALTDAAQFDKVVHLSDAMKGLPAGGPATSISRTVGSPFTLFAGYITGRQIELVPDQRIVQVWRSAGWKPGNYSIARFELSDAPGGCKLVFDHTGFPAGEAQHLADGWKGNYWQPLAKVLG